MGNRRELPLISVFESRWAGLYVVALTALLVAAGCAASGGLSVAVEGAQTANVQAAQSDFGAAGTGFFAPMPTSVFIAGASRARHRTDATPASESTTSEVRPTTTPLPQPTPTPSPEPPTGVPEPSATAVPTAVPATAPTAEPIVPPTEVPAEPTAAPTDVPTEEPAAAEPETSDRPTLPAQQYAPFAAIGDLTLVLPSLRVEHVGFHQAIRSGAQQMTALESPVPMTVMESRGRGTGSHTAADIVVEPGVAIVAPVSGVVIAANNYTLYCEHEDAIVVIEPDGFPGWEAKVLHISGLTVAPGDRVVGGQTVIANGPTVLPFESQVDDHTHAPAWPHVHIETVDTSIPHESNGSPCP